jgi:CRISPR-associated endonuclease/helicase Cas3
LKEIKQRVGLNEDQVIKLLDKGNDFLNLASSCRHRLGFAFHDGDFSTVRDQIVKAAIDGKKVLVVLNTVQAACRMYGIIKEGPVDGDIKMLLLHSRFVQRQRQELEKLAVDKYMPNPGHKGANAPCIIVATQVVEASLDIDADLLFTEPAPADSLVQRMGRVYRRYARSKGNNAPDESNVIIMLNKEEVKDKDIQLSSGLGVVYDRHLTALSLVMLLAQADHQKDMAEHNYEFLDREPWAGCFPSRDKKNKKTKEKNKQPPPNQALAGLVEAWSNKKILLQEKEKMDWVEATYEALESGNDKNLTIDLGNYLRDYQKTLEILDHGYCSDKRQDAMKLFRDVSDVQGIPQELVAKFDQDVASWIAAKQEQISYLELTTDILPGYIINCPYRPWQNKRDLFKPLDVDKIMQQLPDNMDKNITRQKLKRWLSDLCVISYPYHSEKGLIYY